MKTDKTYSGSCFCGEVRFTVTGDPVLMGYCHCESCRLWSAAPISAFSLWQPEVIQVTHGAESIGTSNRTKNSDRKWCRSCGGHVFTVHPGMALTEVCAAIIPDLPFEPGVHVHYQESVLHIHDGLPKMKDLPSEAGGSGVSLPE
jgi:hypothetical protein